jgi:hypothetical protein
MGVFYFVRSQVFIGARSTSNPFRVSDHCVEEKAKRSTLGGVAVVNPLFGVSSAVIFAVMVTRTFSVLGLRL